MAGLYAPSPKPTWHRCLAVLLGCVVSLTAPFDMDTVVQVLDGSVANQLPSAIYGIPDDNDDEDNLVRPTAPQGRRDSRKQPRLAGPPTAPQNGFVLRCVPRLQSSRWLALRPGGEHAFRNGCGTPLLC